MTWQPARQQIPTNQPALETLRIMGRTALATADTQTFREWASRLATKAPPRDYVGQLGALYQGIIDRWRYVQERGEWVHGSPRSLIAHVLGTKYNGDPDPTRTDLEGLPSVHKGWGDCDDVAMVAAAGALALGMTPMFRVSGPPAHVSVMVRTPRGEMVSVDPVGHPEHPFGWSAPSRSGKVYLFDMTGQQVAGPEFQGLATMSGVEPMQDFGSYLSGYDGEPVQRIARPHYAAVRSTDVRGPRVLAVPVRTYRMLRRGQAPHGHAAVDEFGEVYEYDATRDLWLQSGTPAANTYRYAGTEFPTYAGFANVILSPYGKIGDRLRRWGQKVGRGIRRVVQRVGKAVRFVGRRVIAPILQSKWAQRAIGAALQAVGVPRRLTAAFMAAAGTLVKKVGIIGLIKLIRRDRKKALQILAAAGKAGLKAAGRPFGAYDDGGEVAQTWVTQRGVTFPGQHVMGFIPAPGVFGAAELEIADRPTPGRWYRIAKGDTLLGITSKAYGLKAGPERLKKSRWIAHASANAFQVDPRITDKGLYPNGRPDLLPRYACDPGQAINGVPGKCFAPLWIPEAEGDEPPELVEESGPEPPPLPDLTEPEPPMPPPTQEEAEPIPPPEPEPVAEPSPPPEPRPTAPPQPPIAREPAPEIREPVIPKAEQPEAPPPPECPEWFRPSPSGSGACVPALPCPPGMEWASVRDGGPPPLGGCRRISAMPPSPEEPPEPAPPIVLTPSAPPRQPQLTTPAYQPGVIPPAFPRRDEVPSRPPSTFPPSPEEPPIMPAPIPGPPLMPAPPSGGFPSWLFPLLLFGK